jgi:hypothetical protein
MQDNIITMRGNKDEWNNFVQTLKVFGIGPYQYLRPIIIDTPKFEFDKMKQFVNSIITEYNQSRTVDIITNTQEVTTTDGTFLQIGKKYGFEREIFMKPKGRTVTSPIVHGFGREVAIAEENYIINEILKLDKVNKIKVKTSKFDLSFIVKESYDLDRCVLIIPSNFIDIIYDDKKFVGRLKYGRYTTIDDRIKILIIPEIILKDKAILVGEMSCLWRHVKHLNPITDKLENIHIILKKDRVDDEIDVEMKTLIKLDIILPEKIKIFEIID